MMKWLILACLLLVTASVRAQEEAGEEEYDYGEEEVVTKEPVWEDPCLTTKCGEKMECILDGNKQAKCICKRSCPPLNHPSRNKVCSNQDETFDSLCDLEREKCMCEHGEQGCKANRDKAKLKHYGRCQNLPSCSLNSSEQFPIRIRRWISVVMFDLGQRGQLKGGALDLARDAINSDTPWVIPTLWKFCDMDEEPRDGELSRDELLDITAPLMTLEGCVVDFMKGCDNDKSGGISLSEWGNCMGLDSDQINNVCSSL